VGALLWSALSPRQAGNSGTGSISLGRAQQITQLLNEAEVDIANGKVVTALAAYQQVLRLDPRNVAALTQTGWLDFSAGSSARNATLTTLGITYLHEAITRAPRLAAPRLYYAIAADATPGNQRLAKSEFAIFLTLHPSKGQLAVATPFLRKLGIKPT
jgi:cytochrome c-type biogenesis protein CcmH/NrfG